MKKILAVLSLIIFAVAISIAQLANSAWPMHGHDVFHSGRSPFTGPSALTKKWEFTAKDAVYSTPVIAEDGTIYVGSLDKNLYAISPNGTRKWAYATGDSIYSCPAIGKDGTIYVGSDDKKLYAINPDGTKKWSFAVNDNIFFTSPAIGSDGTIYVGLYSGKVYAINPDGTQKWVFTSTGEMCTNPALGTDGTIYFSTNDSKLYAIKPDGTQKWIYTFGRNEYCSPTIGPDGTIYIIEIDNTKLYAITPNGVKKWAFDTLNEITTDPSVSIDGTIYIGTGNNQLFSINPNGTLKWIYKTAGFSTYYNPTIAVDGTIFAGSEDGKIYAINSSGRLKYAYNTNTSISTSLAINTDNTIYYGSFNDSKLYAFGNSNSQTSITVISPNGGEQWQRNTMHPITWTNTGNPGNVKIELLKGGIVNSVIAANVQNTGSYNWTIPAVQVAGTDYKVKLSSVADVKVFSQSVNDFAITTGAPIASITVTTPNGNEQWQQGSAHPITWTSSSVSGYVKIELYKAGILNSAISSGVVNTGTYNWTIPASQTAGVDYRIKISSVANATVTDSSDADFAITVLSSTITTPVQMLPVDNSLNLKTPVILAWHPVANAVSYEYEVYSQVSSVVPVEKKTVPTTTATIQYNLVPGNKYTWRVRAINASDATSEFSPKWSFRTIVLTVPLDTPTLISPADGAIDVPIATIFSWNAVTDAIAYDIEVSINANFANRVTLSTTATSQKATLANNTVYYWRVRAKKGNNLSPWSATGTFTTIGFIPTSGVDAAISNSKGGSQLMGLGVINDTGDLQTVQLEQPVNRQSEFYVLVKNTGNETDSFVITSTSKIDSKWRVYIYDISGIDRTLKVFNGGWSTYSVKPGEFVKILLRFATVSGMVIDESNPPTQSVTITAKSIKDITAGSTTPASDTVIGTAVLVKRSGL